MELKRIKGLRYGITVICSCDFCGKEFKRPAADKRGIDSKTFCNKVCLIGYEKNRVKKKKEEKILCHCGCEKLLPKHGSQMKPISFIKGHNHKGKLCNFWKGGKTKTSRDTSPERTKWKMSVLERDNFTCHSCGKRGGGLHIHHIYPFHLYPQFNHEVWNGLTLCKKCHYGIEATIKSIAYIAKKAA